MNSFKSDRRKQRSSTTHNSASAFTSIAGQTPQEQNMNPSHAGHSLADFTIHHPGESAAATPIQKVDATHSQGQPDRPEQAPSEERHENRTGLPDALKAGVESLSGYSLDDIRVHYNSPRPAEVQALAYTQGTEIHVGPGQEQHLAHEAWHVVQQKQGRVQATMQMKGVAINDDEGLEREADVMGEMAIQTKLADPNISVEGQLKPLLSTFPMQLMPKRRRDESSESESSESESSDSEDEDWDPTDYAADPMEPDDILKSDVRKSLSFNSQAKAWMKLDTPRHASGAYECHICKQPILKGEKIDQDHLPPWKDRLTAFIKVKGLTEDEADEITGASMIELYNMRGSVFAHSSCNRSHIGEDNYKKKWGTAEAWYKAGGGHPFK